MASPIQELKVDDQMGASANTCYESVQNVRTIVKFPGLSLYILRDMLHVG